jgi:hypothetical protein
MLDMPGVDPMDLRAITEKIDQKIQEAGSVVRSERATLRPPEEQPREGRPHSALHSHPKST